jgi:hypothetical protein
MRQGRYGPAALSLGAGYIFGQFWADTIAGDYGALGEALGISAWHDFVFVVLVTVPALLVLILSPKRQSIIPKPVGAFALAALAVALLLPIFSLALVMDAQSRAIYETIENNKEILITAALALGLIDIAFARHPKRAKHGKD